MTGTAETEAGELWDIYKLDVVVIPTNRPIARHDLNDRIYKTAREKYAAVIEEIVRLVGEGRPVLVGTTSVEISQLLSKMLDLRKIPHNVLNAKLHQKEAEIVAQAGKPGVVTIATNMAGRGTDIKLTAEVKEAGGLAILGTERHESRRVDRQLRGRAGRQGDPGSSIFFVSLEDHLMRLFASDRLAAMMDKMGFEEGEVLEHSMLNKAVERAQKKVEENNFGIRKRLLEYDDVMNSQREVIYKRRRHALMGERIEMDVMNTLYDAGRILIDTHHPMEDFESFSTDVMRIFAIESPFDADTFRRSKADELTDLLYDAVEAAFKHRSQQIAELAYPTLHQVYTEQGHVYERIMIPLTDGRMGYNVGCDLKEADASQGRSIMREFEKAIVLHIIDEAWKEHLREMDELRNSVQNASYENKDPLLIYKLESYELFRQMIEDMNRRTASVLMRVRLNVAPPQEEAPREVEIREAAPESRRPAPQYREQRHEVGSAEEQEERRHTPAQSTHTIGRNDPCPCGSGKKFKHCHGKGF